MLKNKIIVLFIILLISTQGQSVITVGAGGIGVCDFDNLQDAYTSAITNNDHFIRVTSEQTIHDTFVIDEFIQITGGFDNCAAADSNTVGANLTEWDGDNTDTVITIHVNSVLPIVLIENFRIFNGNNTGFEAAGGVKVTKGDLTLINSLVELNDGAQGGGIKVAGASSSVTVQDTLIQGNTATLFGGGVTCNNSANFTMTGNSVIQLNTTNDRGAGIFGANNCQILINNGTRLAPSIFGIFGNIAKFGAGVYLSTGADMIISGSNTAPAQISNNVSSDTNEQFAGGGGVFLTGSGTTLTATNTHINGNTAVNYGAGMVVEDSALITMKRANAVCWDNDKCSSLSGNRITAITGHSAAGHIDFGGTANINQTYISNNQANSKTVFRVNDFASARLEGNIITGNKGLSGATTQSLFEVTGQSFDSTLDLLYNTVASNLAFVTFVLNTNSSTPAIRVFNSIIWDQSDIIAIVGGNNAAGVFNCNYVHETGTLFGSEADNFVIDPLFEDINNNDFHLSSISTAQNLCSEDFIVSQYTDLNANPRGVDELLILPLRGIYDAGAYETQLTENDAIFKNGFE